MDMTEPFRFPRYGAELEERLCHGSRGQIRKWQSQRLRHVVRYCWEQVPFYRRLWGEAGVSPDDIRDLDDLDRLPTWNVEDQRRGLEQHPPFGDHYLPDVRDDVAFILSTSGTTGSPRLVPVSYRDLPGLQDVMARSLQFLGLGPGDLLHVTFTYAPMGAAWACTWAAQGAGVGLIPASSGRTTPSERQVDLIHRAGATCIMGTPSFMLHLAERARELGIDPAATSVRMLISAGELSSPGTRAALEEAWGAANYDLFGSVDTLTWSSMDCEASRREHGRLGMHIWEDACVIEALDENQRPLPNGEYGEMTVTSWAWRTSPRIRFRTGDAIAVVADRCPCGRTLARMLPVRGRVDHVLRVNAVNIWPMAIENALHEAEPRVGEWLVEAARAESGDRLAVTVEWSDPGDAGFAERMTDHLRLRLGTRALDVALAAPGSTAERTGAGREAKIKRVFDLRQG